MSESPPAAATPHVPTLSELFLGFLAIALTGFGGVLPWARIVLVERRRWLSDAQFSADLALSQFLPGPNIMNLSILIGSRFRGPAGAVACAFGLAGFPTLLMIVCGAFYSRYSDVAWLRGILAGMGAAAAGLLISLACKLAAPLLRERRIPALAVALIAFTAVALVRIPLYWVVVLLAPASVAVFWWRGK
ncbi:MAG TPA: chromate transporter [Xanthobacteraceae bacterium]|nr:chromate transporter [Xanthobacteraceae bacterium]